MSLEDTYALDSHHCTWAFAASLVEEPNARICGEGLAACSLEAGHVVGSLGMQTVLEQNPILVLRVAAEARGGRPRGTEENHFHLQCRARAWKNRARGISGARTRSPHP